MKAYRGRRGIPPHILNLGTRSEVSNPQTISAYYVAHSYICKVCTYFKNYIITFVIRCRLKCDDTRTETRLRLSAKRTSPFKSAGASIQSTTGSWGVQISGSNAGYTLFWGSEKSTGYLLHSPVSPSLPLPYVTVCHHISTGLHHFLSFFHVRPANQHTLMCVALCHKKGWTPMC
jgi:hypothetical protein